MESRVCQCLSSLSVLCSELGSPLNLELVHLGWLASKLLPVWELRMYALCLAFTRILGSRSPCFCGKYFTAEPSPQLETCSFYFFHVCLCVPECMYVCHVQTVPAEARTGHQIPLQTAVSCSWWALRAEPRSSGRVTSNLLLNHFSSTP